jgi:uncharacterized protein (TIGR02246 family)
VPDDATLREVLDRQAICDLLHRYAAGLDRRRPDLVASCFTPDVEAEYAGERLTGGRDGILAYTGVRTAATYSTMHFVTNVDVTFDGPDAARAVSYGLVALHEAGPDGRDRVRLRGIEYTDDLVRTDGGGWLIRRRRHAPCWESVTEPTAMPVIGMRR